MKNTESPIILLLSLTAVLAINVFPVHAQKKKPPSKPDAPTRPSTPKVQSPEQRAANLKMVGDFFSAKGAEESAIVKYTAAIDLNPMLTKAYYSRGLSHARVGEHELAIADFNKVIEIDPNFPDAHEARNRVYKVQSALKDLLVTIYRIHDETSPTGCNNLGVAYAATGNQKRAIYYYDKGIGLNPRMSILYRNRGKAYSKRQMYAPAIADFTKAIELKPDDLQAYADRAEAYEKSGNLRLAKADRARAQPAEPVTLPDNIKVQPISVPPPKYPVEAKKAGIIGTVIVEVLIDKKGSVIQAKAISGPRELAAAATGAAMKAKFKPTLVKGRPAQVSGTITYNFER